MQLIRIKNMIDDNYDDDGFVSDFDVEEKNAGQAKKVAIPLDEEYAARESANFNAGNLSALNASK